MTRAWAFIKKWYKLIAAALVAIITLGYATRKRPSTVEQRHLRDGITDAAEDVNEAAEDAAQALEDMPAEDEARDAEIEVAALEARHDVESTQYERIKPGAIKTTLSLLAFIIPLFAPSTSAAQMTEAITAAHMHFAQAAHAEVPAADVGPCLPSEGRWVDSAGVSRCHPCPGVGEYVTGFVGLPAHCPALSPGVLVNVDKFKRIEADAAEYRARSGALQTALDQKEEDHKACEAKRLELAKSLKPVLKSCDELAGESGKGQGFSFWTVAGAAVVGVAVGYLGAQLLP